MKVIVATGMRPPSTASGSERTCRPTEKVAMSRAGKGIVPGSGLSAMAPIRITVPAITAMTASGACCRHTSGTLNTRATITRSHFGPGPSLNSASRTAQTAMTPAMTKSMRGGRRGTRAMSNADSTLQTG